MKKVLTTVGAIASVYVIIEILAYSIIRKIDLEWEIAENEEEEEENDQ